MSFPSIFQPQLDALINRHRAFNDLVIVTIAGRITFEALNGREMDSLMPSLGGQNTSRMMSVYTSISQLKGAQFTIDFDIGSRVYIGDPQAYTTTQILDLSKWELKDYQPSPDGNSLKFDLQTND